MEILGRGRGGEGGVMEGAGSKRKSFIEKYGAKLEFSEVGVGVGGMETKIPSMEPCVSFLLLFLMSSMATLTLDTFCIFML